MSRLRKFFLILAFLFSNICIFNAIADFPPPPPGGGHGGGANQIGAPIDDGLSILLVFGAVYGSFKLYRTRKQSGTETLPE